MTKQRRICLERVRSVTKTEFSVVFLDNEFMMGLKGLVLWELFMVGEFRSLRCLPRMADATPIKNQLKTIMISLDLRSALQNFQIS